MRTVAALDAEREHFGAGLPGLDLLGQAHPVDDVHGRAEQVDRVPARLAQCGARSTTVTAKPYRVSQWARTGPATLAPEMRTRMDLSLLNGR
nr:hypothetical protein GCM10020093_070250 [Planobispora longispora]